MTENQMEQKPENEMEAWELGSILALLRTP